MEFYCLTCKTVGGWPYDRKRVAAQAMASADSVHRNIAEGYCRRSVREYLNFLNIALASLGENVSGLHAYHSAGQINDETFETLDALAFRLENGLLRLVASLERKRNQNDWIDHLHTPPSQPPPSQPK
ncbi:MAG: four helix bundle protein [Planctomycetes bacterium]|nr:four helix bundle protein [Planctomycetota bacterium]